MQGSGSGNNRRAPLAFRDSFESQIEEGSEMKEFWTYETKPKDQDVPNQTWSSKDFYELSRKQQNYKMYKAIAPVVIQMFSEWSDLVSKLNDIERRIEIIQIHQDLDEQNNPTLPREQPNRHYYLHEFEKEEIQPTITNADIQGWLQTSSDPNQNDKQAAEPTIEVIEKHKIKNQKIVINIGGVRHEVMWKLLEKRPLTRLGMLAKARTHESILKLVDSYSLDDNELYFDRDPMNFNSILNYYRTDRLHCIDEVCILDFSADLEFWKIKDINLEICCVEKFFARREHSLEQMEKAKMLGPEADAEEDFGNGYFAKYQKAVWDLFEKPQSSFPAKMVSILSVSLVLISTVGMCFNTFPWMQIQDINGDPVDNPTLALVEAFCISYFTIEYLFRLAGSPVKWDFMKGTMNVVDCLAIAPYYLDLFFAPPPELDPTAPRTAPPTSSEDGEEEEDLFADVGRIMQVLRIARLMRILKLARRSVGLQSMAHTVRTSWKNLGLLFSLVVMGMLFFGSLEYFIENEEADTGFYSIPQGMWWAVQTLTSLGYGDFTPVTILGKLVGSMCAVSGVLVMALPIPIVVDNFGNYYAEQKKIEAKEIKKEAQDKQAEVDKAAEKVANQGLVKTLSSKIAIKSPSIVSLEDYSKTEQTTMTSLAHFPRSQQNGTQNNSLM
eukprot:GFUD01038832.1.p1 GENE.GFUD01038832.1~~GFUD01038832.1.p1  ORF type:complete len:667 (+),score=162.04 GFUD01038832.1:111-2111(+)